MILNGSDLSSFGAVLKDFRLKRGLTQQQLAEKLGVRRNTVGSWERGDFLPASKAQVLELAKSLHLDNQGTRHMLEASLTALAPHWLVPLPRNPYFTGRKEILEALHTQLGGEHAVALTQSSALHGLGGVGKTQIALEYAYRHALEYSAVFWIGAETDEQVAFSLLRIAEVLQLPGREDKEQQRVNAAVQRWLSAHGQWLLIWDNVEDLTVLDRFLPAARQGAILITTRRQALGTLARGVDLLPMDREEGMLFLLRRAKMFEREATDEQIHQFAQRSPTEYAATEKLVTVLGGLPLALDQAGAYIEETGCSLVDYLRHYEHQHMQLLDRRGTVGRDHPHSVTTTFQLALERVEQEQPRAVDLLRVCAFLYADAIPEELFTEGAAYLGPALACLASDSCQLDQTIAILRSLSLVHRQPETHTLSTHRLLQAVLYEWMSEPERVLWLGRLTAALNALFPEDISDTSTWERCERLLPHVLAEAAAIPDHAGDQALVQVLCKIADYLRERAQYKQAEQLYRRAVQVGEQQLGAEHPDLAPALDGLALLAQGEGRHEQAASLAQKALHLSDQALGPDHLQVASSLHALATIYREQAKDEQAEQLFKQALCIWEREYGPDHPQVAASLNDLALLYWWQGRYEQAEALLQRAIHFWEQTRGSACLQIASPITNLALLYWKQGKYGQAEPLFKQALRIWEQKYGPDHPIKAYALTGLAILYGEQGRHEQAEPVFEHVLRIWEQTGGPEHPQVSVSLVNLGATAASLGKYERAEALYQRALAIEKNIWGPEHPKAAYLLTNLADLYVKQERYEQAEGCYQQAILVWERCQGSDDPLLAYPLSGLANLSCIRGKYEQAESFYQRALHLREQHLGQCHPDTAETLHDLALLRQQQGNLSKALVLAERALAIRCQALGDAHPKTVATRALYTHLLQEQASAPQSVAEQAVPEACCEERREGNASLSLRQGEASSAGSDPLQAFLEACCELHPRAWCRSADLWRAYQQWSEEHQERYPLSRRAFIAQLKAHGCRADRTTAARIWRGIAVVKQET